MIQLYMCLPIAVAILRTIPVGSIFLLMALSAKKLTSNENAHMQA